MIRAILILCCLAQGLSAQTVTPARMIRPGETLGPLDLVILPQRTPGALASPDQALGQEARVVLYPGRPIGPGDLRPPALVQRNDLIELVFQRNGLQIVAEGRVLDRGAVGDRVQVLNTASRLRITGQVLPDGRVRVD